MCDGKHDHLPWGRVLDSNSPSGWRWATAVESVYPDKLCEEFTERVFQQLIQDGVLKQQPQMTMMMND